MADNQGDMEPSDTNWLPESESSGPTQSSERPSSETGMGARMLASRPDLTQQVSPAQHRVLELLLEGLTEPLIATRLDRSRHTVHDHTKAIYSSLKVNNRVQLVLLFSQPPR